MLLIDQTQKAYSVIPIICPSRRSKTLVMESRTVIPGGGGAGLVAKGHEGTF